MGITDDVPNYDKDKKIHTVTNNTITKWRKLASLTLI